MLWCALVKPLQLAAWQHLHKHNGGFIQISDISATWVHGPALAGCVDGAPCLLLAQLYDDLGKVVVCSSLLSSALSESWHS